MFIDILLISIAFIALVIGSYTDIKIREVPDWLNFSLIAAGLGIRLIYSSVTEDWYYILYGLIGFAVCMAVGYAMFYAGQWGGGDAKMIMGIGALIGLKLTIQPLSLLVVFIINILVVGSIYGLVQAVFLAIKHRKSFIKRFRGIMHHEKIMKLRKAGLILIILLFILTLLFVKDSTTRIILLALILLAYFTIYLMIAVKAVELAAMYYNVEPKELTEGEWIAKDYKVNGKYICGPKDLGITKKQIKQLILLKKQNKIDKIQIKKGIPFVPSFLIAFVLSILFGAWWFIFVFSV